MKVLISGATGFVGSRLCRELSGAGHQVSALSRDPSGARDQLETITDAHAWEPVEEPAPGAALEAADAVVHLAGEPVNGRWTAAKKERIRRSRVAGTRNLVDALAAAEDRPGVLVTASAIGYYGDRGDEKLTEDVAPGEGFLADVCQAWEQEAARAGELGVRVVRLRIAIVLGEGGGALDAMLLPFKLGLGGPLGSGRQWWSWIHRDDLVGIVRFALENDRVAGVYNAAAPAPARQKEFARTLGKVLHRPAFLPAPAFALKLILGGFATELLWSRRAVSERIVGEGYEFEHPELDEALDDALH